MRRKLLGENKAEFAIPAEPLIIKMDGKAFEYSEVYPVGNGVTIEMSGTDNFLTSSNWLSVKGIQADGTEVELVGWVTQYTIEPGVYPYFCFAKMFGDSITMYVRVTWH